MVWTKYDYHPASEDSSTTMAQWWDLHWRGRFALGQNREGEPIWPVIRHVLQHPGRLLEAGCGVPHWVRFLGERGHQAVGVDYAISGLQVGKKIDAHLQLVRGDFCRLPFADESFDYVVSFGAVEHDIQGPDVALCEFRRVLRPSGYLVCSVPCLNWCRQLAKPLLVLRDWGKTLAWLRRLAGKTERFAFYEYVWSPREYRGLLARAGFEVTDLRPFAYPARASSGKGWSDLDPVARSLGSAISRWIGFFNPHMMVAICKKR